APGVLGHQTVLLSVSGLISPVSTRAYPTCLTRSLSCADTRLSNAESLSPHCPYPSGKLSPVPSLVKAATFGRVLDTKTCSVMRAVYHAEVCDRINMPVGIYLNCGVDGRLTASECVDARRRKPEARRDTRTGAAGGIIFVRTM